MSPAPCPNRIDSEDSASPECGDEGELCEACGAKDEAYWRGYFGLRPGMTKEERRAQLEAFRPLCGEEVES